MPTASDLAVDVYDAVKTYRSMRNTIHALRGVSITVRRGEVFGLLGPNGAGKSTLVKILMTVITPTSCQGTMLGKPIGDKPTLAKVGYLPEHHRFPDYLTAKQVLHFFGAMSGVDRATRRKRAPMLLDMVGLSNAGNRTVRQFSKGMRQRLGLAQAMINDPDMLLLDEPTDGVDPEGRRDIRNLLANLRAAGKGILINTHILAELELLCDRAAIIHSGELHKQGTIAELTTFNAAYEIEARPTAGTPAPSAEALTVDLAHLAGAQLQITTKPTGEVLIRWATTDPADIQPIIDRLRAAAWQVTRVYPYRATLEDAFIKVIEQAKAQENAKRHTPAHSTPTAGGQP